MFTHLDKNGRGQMVDVSQKEISQREAIAKGSIELKNETIEAIKNEKIKKGDGLQNRFPFFIQRSGW